MPRPSAAELLDADVAAVFDEYSVFDGRDHYLPRNQLVAALQALGLNPTCAAVEAACPSVTAPSSPRRRRAASSSSPSPSPPRGRRGGSGGAPHATLPVFRACFAALRRTAAFDGYRLADAFEAYDPHMTGFVRADQFLSVLRARSDDLLSDAQAADMLRRADPAGAGVVDYVAYARQLEPLPHKPYQRRMSQGSCDGGSSGGETEAAEEHTMHTHARQRAVATLMNELLGDADAMEKTRQSDCLKVSMWLRALKGAAVPDYSDEADVRVEAGLNEAERRRRVKRLSELKEAVARAREEIARCEARRMEMLRAWRASRQRVDVQMRTLPQKYSALTYQSVRKVLVILQGCRHRVLADTWAPPSFAPAAVAAFRRALGGGDGGLGTAHRGSHPIETPESYGEGDGAEEVKMAFLLGCYIHHGTSETHGTEPLCLLPADLLKSYPSTAAARLLTVPCELDDMGCGLDDESPVARTLRAAFHDGVHGKYYEKTAADGVAGDPDSASDERIRACNQRGLWYHAECEERPADAACYDEDPQVPSSPLSPAASPAAPVQAAEGLPHFLLGRWAEYLARLEELRGDVRRARDLVRLAEGGMSARDAAFALEVKADEHLKRERLLERDRMAEEAAERGSIGM